MNVVSLSAQLAAICEMWSPVIVGELNGQHVKLAKIKGEFIWHHHAEADELFLILKGLLTIKLRDGDEHGEHEVRLTAGEFFIVPRGVQHKPIADDECHVLLFEPAGTLNTGNVRNARTVDEPRRA